MTKNGRRIEQQQAGAPGHDHGVEISPSAGQQSIARLGSLRSGLLDLKRHRCGFGIHDGGKQSLFIGEMMVESASGHAGLADNLRCPDFAVRSLGEQLPSSRDQRGAGCIRPFLIAPFCRFILHTCSLYHQTGGVLLSFEVDDVDAQYDRLKTAGVTLVLDIRDEDFGQRHFMVTDPNGVMIDVIKAIPSSAEFAAQYAPEALPQ
jgi:hypothetical protein